MVASARKLMLPSEQEIAEVIAMLESGSASDRANMSWVLARTPIADARIATTLERLLDDRRICVLSIPYELGEVRWAIAHALASTRRAIGIGHAVQLDDVLTPIPSERVYELAEQSELPIPTAPGVQGMIDRLEALRELNRAPKQSLVLFTR